MKILVLTTLLLSSTIWAKSTVHPYAAEVSAFASDILDANDNCKESELKIGSPNNSEPCEIHLLDFDKSLALYESSKEKRMDIYNQIKNIFAQDGKMLRQLSFRFLTTYDKDNHGRIVLARILTSASNILKQQAKKLQAYKDINIDGPLAPNTIALAQFLSQSVQGNKISTEAIVDYLDIYKKPPEEETHGTNYIRVNNERYQLLDLITEGEHANLKFENSVTYMRKSFGKTSIVYNTVTEKVETDLKGSKGLIKYISVNVSEDDFHAGPSVIIEMNREMVSDLIGAMMTGKAPLKIVSHNDKPQTAIFADDNRVVTTTFKATTRRGNCKSLYMENFWKNVFGGCERPAIVPLSVEAYCSEFSKVIDPKFIKNEQFYIMAAAGAIVDCKNNKLID